MDELLSHIRLAVRKLLRAPLFSSIALLTLAVGIGANAAIFSVVDGVLLKPLPYPDAERLVGLWHKAPGMGVSDAEQSQATYFTYRADNRTLVDMGLWNDFPVSITGAGEPERVPAIRVTDATLTLLGARASVGRLFTAADDAPGAPLTVVLSHGYWQRRFGAGSNALGQVLRINGQPHTVIGVLPPEFRVVDQPGDVFIPARLDPARAEFGNFSYTGIARLRPGVTIAEATADLARLIPVALTRFPGPISQEQLDQAGFAPEVRPLKEDIVGDVSAVLWVLLGTVGLVLMLACANVANLFLVQAEMRQREVAVRTALGAGRSRLVRSFLVESLVLGLLGGALGLLLATLGLRLLLAIGPETLPRLGDIAIDGRVVLFTAVITVGAAILFGLFPALRYGRADTHLVLKEGGRSVGAGRDRHRVRNALVVVQVALALVLLIGSGLMVRSVAALRDVAPGFTRPEQVLTFTIYVPEAEVPDPAAVARLETDLLRRIGEMPGVQSVGGTSILTMTGEMSNSNPLAVEGRPVDPARLPPVRDFRFIAPGYHETLGNRLVAGRHLTWADVESRAHVVVLNEELARAEFTDPAAAIGKRVRDILGTEWFEVVGVVGSVRYAGVSRPAPTVIYFPLVVANLWETPVFVNRALDYVVRTAGEPTALAGPIRDLVWSVNPSLPLAQVRTLGDVLDTSMARPAFAMTMLSIAAVVALILGLVGIYGVVSYIVSQRTREIGVRVALGAEPARVRRMVVRQAAAVTGLGVGLGLVAAAGMTRLMSALLYEVRPLDLPTYLAVTVVISLVSLVASWIPARRAARVDPTTALRAD